MAEYSYLFQKLYLFLGPPKPTRSKQYTLDYLNGANGQKPRLRCDDPMHKPKKAKMHPNLSNSDDESIAYYSTIF